MHEKVIEKERGLHRCITSQYCTTEFNHIPQVHEQISVITKKKIICSQLILITLPVNDTGKVIRINWLQI